MENKKPIYKRVWFWIIVIIIVIAIASSNSSNNTNQTSSGSTTNTTQQTNNEPVEYLAVNIDELEQALKNNAAAAKDTYKGKYFEITGKLGTIDSDLKYISLLSTTDEWDLTGIHCNIKNEEQKNVIKTLNKGDTIVIKGKITDVGEVLGYYLDIDEVKK